MAEQEKEQFLEWIANERKDFARFMQEDWLNKPIPERVAIENLLIAYDQMKERLDKGS